VPAQIDPLFQSQINALASGSKTIADSVLMPGTQRKAMQPELGDWDGTLTDVPGMTGAFDRSDLNQKYEEILSDSGAGTVADCAALKLQIDWIGALERAYRLRHGGQVRAWMHATGRRKGHGQDGGVVKSALRYVQDVIKAGQAATPPEGTA
jgi:hypothetical protein